MEMTVQVSSFNDGTASDAWLPTQGKVSDVLTATVHELECSVSWNDQGWGNQKGAVMVALIRDGTEVASENLFSNQAPHSVETQTRVLREEAIVLQAQPGDHYALFHRVGGGGGH
jgi:hypothetical protein